MATISRGDVVLCDFNLAVGTEQAEIHSTQLIESDS
jgi:hypothetical protein